MRLPKISSPIIIFAASVVSLGIIGAGTSAFAQNATPQKSSQENIGSMHSRTGSTLRGQALTETPDKAHTVQPGNVPVSENIGSMHSRTGSTLRGQALTETPDKAHTVQPGTVSAPESIGSPDSLIGRTMRGHSVKPKSQEQPTKLSLSSTEGSTESKNSK